MREPDRVREPGTLFLRTMRACCRNAFVERVFEPAVADMQHEWRESSSRMGRLGIRARGYVALTCLVVAAPMIARRSAAASLPVTGRLHGGRILLLLAGALYVGTAPLFGAFSLPAWAAGLGLAVLLRRWHGSHPSTPVEARMRTAVPVAEINFYSISAGGDVAGLIFAAGSVAILLVGVPQFAWYLAGAVLVAIAFACWLHVRRDIEMRAPVRFASIAQR